MFSVSVFKLKKTLKIIVLSLIIKLSISFNSQAADPHIGTGEVKLSSNVIREFKQYVRNNNKKPMVFIITTDGTGSFFLHCPHGQCQPPRKQYRRDQCERHYNKECKIFAMRRTVKWKNGINTGKAKQAKFKYNLSDTDFDAKLEELGFTGNSTTPKITKKKKEPKKTVKKYELKGERSIALSWEGYEELIAGTVNFDETDYKGTLNLPLPNNDGTCDGTYSLQKGGKGTWQIACSNNMGAAGTLKWVKDGGVTGTGRDHNDKKVKFTVSKNS